MKVAFKKSFLKELKRIRDKKLKEAIYQHIRKVESAQNLPQLQTLKKLSGYSAHYRIRVGDHRIGIKVENDVVFLSPLETGRTFTRTSHSSKPCNNL